MGRVGKKVRCGVGGGVDLRGRTGGSCLEGIYDGWGSRIAILEPLKGVAE